MCGGFAIRAHRSLVRRGRLHCPRVDDAEEQHGQVQGAQDVPQVLRCAPAWASAGSATTRKSLQYRTFRPKHRASCIEKFCVGNTQCLSCCRSHAAAVAQALAGAPPAADV